MRTTISIVVFQLKINHGHASSYTIQTRPWALNRMQTHACHLIAFNMFMHFVTCEPNIKWVSRTHDGLSLDYPCDKFGDCSFSRFGSTVQTDRQTDADERFTPVTLVGISNNL